MKRIFKSPRTHLLLLAFSLLVISSVLGLSAYLNDSKRYSSTFRTYTSDELGFDITGTEVTNHIITPGETMDMDVGVQVTGPKRLYVFINYDPPAGLVVNGFNNQSWHPIQSGSSIYYYGSESSLFALDSNVNTPTPILKSITLPVEADNSTSYELKLQGYAIQADHIGENLSPKAVFTLIAEEQNFTLPAELTSESEGGTNP